MILINPRFLASNFYSASGFLLLSLGMAFIYSRILPDTMNHSYWLHSLMVGFLITFSFLAGPNRKQ
jgi:hypothetical protein